MINQHQNRKNSNGLRRLLRAGMMSAAASAIAVLLCGGTAAGQQAPTTGPTSRPSMVADGIANGGVLRMIVGQNIVVNLTRPAKDVTDQIKGVVKPTITSPTSVLLFALKPGVTTLKFVDDDGVSTSMDVVVDTDLALLDRQLHMVFPELQITVSPLNDSIALRGKVPSMQIAEQVAEMASAYGKVHNFLTIAGGQQVMLQVRFAEVSKTAMRNLGVSFGGTDGVTSIATNGLTNATLGFTGTPPGLGVATAAGGSGVTLFGQGRFGVAAFDYFVSASRSEGLVRVLAEPNLSCTSGQTASMLAGGQIPIPVPQPGSGGNTVTIEYHDYGVNLNFTPQVLGDGKIRLRVAPEVSDLDYSDAVTIGGVSVPGFTDRKADTTVELSDGQSFALAGLLNQKISTNNTEIPVLGDLPILGALFRSVSYSRSETELVILVTPRLVAPLNPDQVPSLPGEKWRYPTQLQLYLKHDLGGPVVEKHKGSADTTTAGPPPQFHGSYGFTAVGCGSVTAVDSTSASAQ